METVLPYLPSILAFVGGCLGCLIAGGFTLRQVSREAEEKLKIGYHEKQTLAYQQLWSRLEPTAEYQGREETVRLVRTNEEGYVLNKALTESFFADFTGFFYSEHGLFLSKELRDHIFTTRRFFYELISDYEEDESDTVKLSNTKAKRWFRHWYWARMIIRTDLGLRDPTSPMQESIAS